MLTKIQAKILGTHKSETYGKYTPYHKMSLVQLEQMYEIYKEYYHNTNFSLFVDDFKKKDGAILIFESVNDTVVGFSTVVLNHLKYEGKSYRFIFSGDTVIQKQYWGSRALQNEMFKLIMKTRVRYPFDEVFWMLISKGYKTYLLLANNYYVYYPHAKGKHEHLAPLVQQYCDRFYAQYYDKDTGLLNFGDDYQALKGEVAPITTEMRSGNIKIDFFEKMNPTWKDGTELPCVGHIRWRDVVRYPARFVTKAASKGRHEANSETAKDLDHSEQKA